VYGCRRSPDTGIAEQLSKRSTTTEQARLWQQAADQQLAPGASRLEQTTQPVVARQSLAVSNQVIQARGVGPDFPAGVMTALRITSIAGLENAEFKGMGVVTDVNANGERLSLDLGQNRTITFAARADGKAVAFGVTRGGMLNVEFRARSEPSEREILAVRAPNGPGIARITETGRQRLTVRVQLFDLSAAQVADQSSVDVHVGSAQKRMVPGETAKLGGLTVNLIASRALTGPLSRTIEGSPYAIELIAWSSP